MWKSCRLSWTHPPLRHRSPGNTALPILLQHRGTTSAVAVSRLTRPTSEKTGRVPEVVLWFVTVSVDKGGMTLPTFRYHSMDTYSRASCSDSFYSWDRVAHFSGAQFTLPISGTDQRNLMSEVPVYLCYISGFALWESGWEAEADSCPHCCTSANGWHWWSPWEHFSKQRIEHSPWPHCQQLLIGNLMFLQFCKCVFPDNTSAVLRTWTRGSERYWNTTSWGSSTAPSYAQSDVVPKASLAKTHWYVELIFPGDPVPPEATLTSAGLHRKMPVPQLMLWRLVFCVSSS